MANGKGGGFFAGFLIGAVAGAAAAAFLTQDDARERLAGKAREAGDVVGGVTSQWQSSVTDLYERGRQVVERARSNIDAAVEEGQMTAQTTHDELQRKAEG
jgi:gas vesicle protein